MDGVKLFPALKICSMIYRQKHNAPDIFVGSLFLLFDVRAILNDILATRCLLQRPGNARNTVFNAVTLAHAKRS